MSLVDVSKWHFHDFWQISQGELHVSCRLSHVLSPVSSLLSPVSLLVYPVSCLMSLVFLFPVSPGGEWFAPISSSMRSAPSIQKWVFECLRRWLVTLVVWSTLLWFRWNFWSGWHMVQSTLLANIQIARKKRHLWWNPTSHLFCNNYVPQYKSGPRSSEIKLSPIFHKIFRMRSGVFWTLSFSFLGSKK